MASPSTVLTRGYGSWGSANEVVTLGYGLAEPGGTFRNGTRTFHGSVAERAAVPARPQLSHRVPARPEPDDRHTPSNRPLWPH